MSEERREKVFWLDNRCGLCGHVSPPIYAPDLLKRAQNFKCRSQFNPVRQNSICYNQWGIAMTGEQKVKMQRMLMLAEDKDMLNEKLEIIDTQLNPKDSK